MNYRTQELVVDKHVLRCDVQLLTETDAPIALALDVCCSSQLDDAVLLSVRPGQLLGCDHLRHRVLNGKEEMNSSSS